MVTLSLPSDPYHLSLYIHLPFCKRRCPYCAFYVLVDDPAYHDQFIALLIRELSLYQELLSSHKLVSIYLGGGTPSLISPHLLERLLDGVMSRVCSAPTLEITLEANPETISPEAVSQWIAAGVNRVSIGIQSIHDRELWQLGRGHGSSVALQALDLLLNAPLASVSCDLMMETPRQTLESWQATLKAITQRGLPHLSLYNLTFEENTPFAHSISYLRSLIVSPEEGKRMVDMACEELQRVGLNRYELSAFARPGHESLHNSSYWCGGTFLGIGPSAWSFLPPERFQKIPDLRQWQAAILQGSPAIGEKDLLTPEARQAELLCIHLRIIAGVDQEAFIKRYGPLSHELQEALQRLIEASFISDEQGKWTLTEQGRLFYNQIGQELVVL